MGWVWTAALNVPLLLAGYWTAACLFRLPRGLSRLLASVVVSWSWMTLGVQLLGALGLVGRVPFLAWSLTGLAASAAFRWRQPPSREPETLTSPASNWEFSALLALGLTVWAVQVLGVSSFLHPLKVVSDGPIYHLYFAVRWWKAGALQVIPIPFGESAAPYFPANGDLWFLWQLTGFGGDLLARVGQAPFWIVSGMTTYALARRLGAGSSASLIAACWFSDGTRNLLFSFEPDVDTIFATGYLLSAFFLCRFALEDDRLGSLVLSGLAAGLTLGTKATGFVFVPLLIVSALAAIAWRTSGIRPFLARSVLFLGSALLPCAFWYGRNLFLTGNPLYPAHIEIAGWTILPGGYPRSAMIHSPYYIPGSNLRFLLDTFQSVIDTRLLVPWLAALLGLWAIRKGPRAPEDRLVWIASALAVANFALYWLVIPYRTQQRFMLHGIGLAVVPLARLLDRSWSLRGLATALLALHLVTPWDWPSIPHASQITPQAVSLISLPLTEDALRMTLHYPWLAKNVAFTVLSGLSALATILFWAFWSRSRSGLRLLGAVASTLVAIALPLARNALEPPNTPRVFPPFRDYYNAWIALDYYSGDQGSRIAYAGTDIPYYFFGRDLKNQVFYVNLDDHPSWTLHDYQRTASDRGEPALWDTPRPGWGRLNGDLNAWLRNLADARIDFLVVARCRPDQGPFNLADPEGFPVERVWAEANPDLFTPIYGVFPPDPQMKVFRFHPEKIARIER